MVESTFMDHPSLTGAVWESIIKTVETWRGWKTQVSVPLDSMPHVHVVWVYSVYCSLVSFSDTVPAAQAHAAKCSGFSERVAQNSARHCLLYCWCEHLHCEFTAFLALLFFNFKSSSSFYKLFHSQHTLLAFTVSGIFKEGELCSSRLSSCSIQLNWLCYCCLFFSCCWCKVPWVHHGVLSSVHYSPSWKYWVGLASELKWLLPLCRNGNIKCGIDMRRKCTKMLWMLKSDCFPASLCATVCALSTTSFSFEWQRQRRSAEPLSLLPRLHLPALSRH